MRLQRTLTCCRRDILEQARFTMLKARLAAVDPSTARQKAAAQVVTVPQRSASLNSLDSLSGSEDDEDAGTKLRSGFLLGQ